MRHGRKNIKFGGYLRGRALLGRKRYAKKVVPLHTVKAWGGVKVHLYSLFTSALHCGEWPTLCAGRFTLGRAPTGHRRGGWMGPRASLDGSEKRYLVLLSRIEPCFKVAYVNVRRESTGIT
jgi:hypothetical protein